jgi:hypothetical protein
LQGHEYQIYFWSNVRLSFTASNQAVFRHDNGDFRPAGGQILQTIAQARDVALASFFHAPH